MIGTHFCRKIPILAAYRALLFHPRWFECLKAPSVAVAFQLDQWSGFGWNTPRVASDFAVCHHWPA